MSTKAVLLDIPISLQPRSLGWYTNLMLQLSALSNERNTTMPPISHGKRPMSDSRYDRRLLECKGEFLSAYWRLKTESEFGRG